MRPLCRVLPILAALALMPDPALAYLDPGSGSYLIQVLIGLAAGAAFMIRSTLAVWWDRFRSLFRRSHPERNRPKPRKRK